MAEVQLPDGNIAKIPDFALESTQSKMHDLISALVKSNTKAQAALDKINKNAVDALSKDEKVAEEALKEQQRQTKLLQDQLKDNQSFRSTFSSRIESDMTKMFVGTGNVLTGLAKGALVATTALGGFLVKSFMDAGNSLRQLTTVGLGSTGAYEGTLVDSIASFTQLGMSIDQAAQTLTRFSANATILGRANFSRFVTGMAQSASLSSELGMNFEEAIDAIGDEIDIRRLGSTQRLNLDVAERASIEERIRQTFALSAVTGKSIREISQSSKDFFQNNARVAGLLASLPAQAAEQVRNSIDFGVRVGASVGDQFSEVMDQVFNASAAPIIQATDEFQAISGIGVGAQLLTRQMLELQQGMASGTLTQEQARQQSVRFAENLMNLDAASMNQLRLMSEQSGPSAEFAKQLLLSAQQIRAGGRELIDRMKAEAVQSDATIQAVTGAQNAFNRFKGVFSTVFFRSIVGLTGPMNAFVDEVQKTGGVLDKLSEGVNRIFNAVMLAFGADIHAAGDQAANMATSMQKLGTWIEETSTKIATWIGTLEGDTIGEKLIDALGDGLAFMFAAGVDIMWEATKTIITDYWKEALMLIGGLVALSLAKSAIGAGSSWLTSKMFGDTAGSTVGTGASAAGKGIGSGAQAAGKGVGKGIEYVGKGIGAGLGGFIKGIGNALAALGPKSLLILAGATAIGGSITLIGAGIAAATWLLGKAMPTLAEGLKSFEQLDGDKLQSAGLGMAAVAGGMAAFGLGSAVAGLGALVGAVTEGLAKLFGAEDPMDKLARFAEYDIDAEKVKNNATALALFGAASASAGAGAAVSGLGNLFGSIASGLSSLFGGEDPMEKLQRFASYDIDLVRVTNNANALAAFANSLSTIQESLSDLETGSTANLRNFINASQNFKTEGFDRLTASMHEFSAAAATFILRANAIPDAGEKIAEVVNSMSVLPYMSLRHLGDAMVVLANGLKDFANVTSQSLFDQMVSAFANDTTSDFIESLNMFANEVDSDKLMKTAEAVIAMNAARAGATQQPTALPVAQVAPGTPGTPGTPVQTAAAQDAALMQMLNNTNSTLTQLSAQIATMNTYLRNLRELPAIRTNTQ